MATFLPDSSCMVAALCDWHEHHGWSIHEFDRRLAGGERLILAAPTLVETYSVLTRIPPPKRLSPTTCRTLIDVNFLRQAMDVVALASDAYRNLLLEAPERAIAGGRVYDAVIVACALAANVDALLTLNERHFASLSVQAIEIVSPS